MKLVFSVFLLGVCLLVAVEAFSKAYELQPGIPTSLLEVENLQMSQISGEPSPLAREKRHKKKVVIINQYYVRPGHGQGGCPGCGGYGYGYPNYGYQGGYQGHGGYQGGYGGYGGHGGGHKFKG